LNSGLKIDNARTNGTDDVQLTLDGCKIRKRQLVSLASFNDKVVSTPFIRGQKIGPAIQLPQMSTYHTMLHGINPIRLPNAQPPVNSYWYSIISCMHQQPFLAMNDRLQAICVRHDNYLIKLLTLTDLRHRTAKTRAVKADTDLVKGSEVWSACHELHGQFVTSYDCFNVIYGFFH
jgi:hypothetical protein